MLFSKRRKSGEERRRGILFLRKMDEERMDEGLTKGSKRGERESVCVC
jgi:hypothetical protein